MKVKKDIPCIFIRLIDYRKNNFVEEHIKSYKEKGYVWLLKMGKPANEKYMKEVYESGGGLILKETARNGNKFYYCELENEPDCKDLYYPDYYDEIFKDMYCSKDKIKNLGTWFKITSINPLTDKQVECFKTISTGKTLLECGRKFNQVSQMHVKSDVDLEL